MGNIIYIPISISIYLYKNYNFFFHLLYHYTINVSHFLKKERMRE